MSVCGVTYCRYILYECLWCDIVGINYMNVCGVTYCRYKLYEYLWCDIL